LVKRIALDKFERIARLRIDIDAGHIKPGTMQSLRGSARPAKEI